MNITAATEEEKLAILDEKRITRDLGPELKATLLRLDIPLYMIHFEHYSMLFNVTLLADKVCAVHVYCPRASIKASRVLSLGVINWIIQEAMPGVRAMVTNCLEGTAANMARKLGGIEIKKEGRYVYFVLSVLNLNQFRR
jgi:hypothetical protein